MKGQKVRFSEEAAGVNRLLGAATTARGTIRFQPAPGPAGQRRVVAETELNGIRVGRRVVGRFRASRPVAPKASTTLVATRRGDSLVVRGARVPGATRYILALRGSDGSARVLQVEAARRRVRIAGVSRTLAGTVSLRARGQLGLAGPAARARFAAIRKPPDRFLPFSRLRRGR